MTNKFSDLKNEPFRLKPAGIEKLWGGTRLNDDFSKNIDAEKIAETWECSTHPDGQSIVSSGTYKGLTLSEVITKNPEILGEKLKELSDLPILVKLIDAQQDLSVQVHPNDEQANKLENQNNGKMEFWYVLDAFKDSKLVYGLNHKLTTKQLSDSISDKSIEKYLQKIPVKKGDIFFINPGTIHAIGAGVLIAEIQQNSNITYRLYDYDRIDKNGWKRELHLDKALKVANLKQSNLPRQPMRIIKYKMGCASELLCRCKYFQVERLLINTERTRILYETASSSQSFEIYLCVNGCGIMLYESNKVLLLFKGDCVFLPANSVNVKIHGCLELLRIYC
ncbi:MAG: class I mannose-6-phosphate isomerase [Candidatus Riflebacteria bacterium]|nr:class I mannose-6-phosphate isomerase [Candidatus Riflebacteria bacterium]